jgi:hypothetical protein
MTADLTYEGYPSLIRQIRETELTIKVFEMAKVMAEVF